MRVWSKRRGGVCRVAGSSKVVTIPFALPPPNERSFLLPFSQDFFQYLSFSIRSLLLPLINCGRSGLLDFWTYTTLSAVLCVDTCSFKSCLTFPLPRPHSHQQRHINDCHQKETRNEVTRRSRLRFRPQGYILKNKTKKKQEASPKKQLAKRND